MDKFLGQEIPEKERWQFLQDNADAVEQIVDKEFEKRGLQLLTFSAQLEFSKAVREKIDSRNEVNTNISVLDQQIDCRAEETQRIGAIKNRTGFNYFKGFD
jgi:hypothetical protein